MSNALAIAAVTAVLKSLLQEHLVKLGGSAEVTVLAPDLILPNNTTAGSQGDKLNLFLYQVTPNSGWRNVGLPSRDSGGERVSNPPLGLDLHYLLTAYSKESFRAEMLLGYGVQLLHEISVLTRSAIRKALENLNPPIPLLVTAGLAEQVEQIKICPQSLSSEEISKLWSAFQSHYRPTAAYQVSVVLIESQHSTKSALPVRQPRLHVMPFRQPMLTAVLPQIVTTGSQLTLKGQNLKADLVSVDFETVTASPDSITDSQILVTVPTGLLAGINRVQVIHPLDFGTPLEPHQGFESNVMPFVLRPHIIPPVTAGSGASAGTVEVRVQVNPVIGKSQWVVMRLNEQTSNTPAAAYTAISERRDQDSSAIALTFSSVKAGTYLVRLQVDGAESLLDVDSNDRYTGTPNVTITCPSNCLRSSISLSSALAGNILTVTGEVTIEDENGTALGDVEVSITWEIPDGSTRTETSTTESTGIATFSIAGSRGKYTLTVINLAKKDHSFDAPNSTLSKSITG